MVVLVKTLCITFTGLSHLCVICRQDGTGRENIIGILDYKDERGMVYIWMELAANDMINFIDSDDYNEVKMYVNTVTKSTDIVCRTYSRVVTVKYKVLILEHLR